MKSIVESIQVNEGRNSWSVTDSLSRVREIAHFAAPDAQYLWIYEEGGMIGFLSLDEIVSSFEDGDLDPDARSIKRLNIGESYSADGMNIYVRLH